MLVKRKLFTADFVDHNVQQLCAEYLKKFLEDIPDAHRRWDSVYGDPAIRLEVTPQQEDDSSCGVFGDLSSFLVITPIFTDRVVVFFR